MMSSDTHFTIRVFRVGDIVVLRNPSQPEIRRIASKKTRRVRFTADARSSQVWVWDASRATHYQLLPTLGADRCDVHPYILGGVAELRAHDAVMIGWDNFFHLINIMDSSSRENVIDFLNRLFDFDWTWINKYFYVTDYLKHRKLDFIKHSHNYIRRGNIR